MTLIFASSFTDSLTRLTKQEAGAAALTALELQQDPTGNGKQMHRVERAADHGFWSVRVNRDLRLIVHRDGDRLLLAYAGHHDDAYRWAERKKLARHERTGAMQFVEVPVVDASAPVQPADAMPVAPERRANYPFAMLSEDQLLDVGVPRDWLQSVRETSEDSLFELLEILPAEAAEALLDHATGGKLADHRALQIPGGDPFAHPDAQRRFRAVDGVEELRAALDAPFALWAIFLHPAQRGPVDRPWSGPARVSGSAGTGKTIVAVHRAVHLARANPDANVLLTTFSPSLAAALAEKVELLTEAEPDLRPHLKTRALDQAAHELFTSSFGQPNMASSNQIYAAIAAAREVGHGTSLSPSFLFEEWKEVADGWGLINEAAYAEVPRLGRKTRLGPRQRADAWSAFAFVRAWLADRGLITWPTLYGRLVERIRNGEALPFTHIVIDEAQDLTVAQARFLAAAGGDRPESLFFTGDLGQRIFHQPFSWSKLGLDIRGRSQILKVCYRTSHQIRAAADRLLPASISDIDGIDEGRRGTVSVFDGPPPDICLAAGPDAEIAYVAAFLRSAVAQGVEASEIGVLVRGEPQLKRARAAVKAAGGGAFIIATMHDAKGLEFRTVAVMACDDDAIPDPDRLAAVGDEADLEAVYDTERHLLYVAITRARDNLLVSGISPGSEFLDDIR